MNKSVQTINSPEFINLQPLDLNPLMSSCEIKVLYVGGNRNGSFITKEVASEMAKTLRGAPIVGWYREEKDDFGDHGQQVIIDGEGIRFECLTKPYGFVSPDAKVWFQSFTDTNDFGEETVREYLMTTGYLWTGQFPECKSAVEGDGKPHSMELDEKTLDGHWSKDTKGMDFFIINDAIFSKLCILGEDVEPCFEGSSIQAPEVSASFAKVDTAFKQTLFSMMQDLKFALEGGQQMDNIVNDPIVEPIVESAADPVPVTEPQSADPVPAVEPAIDNEVPAASEPADSQPEDPEPSEPAPMDGEEEEGQGSDPAPAALNESEPQEDFSEKYNLLQAEHSGLQASYAALEESFHVLESELAKLKLDYQELVEFKANIDDAAKDAKIKEFSMLPDENAEKQNIISNKANYTVAEIEEKLAAICFRNNINFAADFSKENKKDEPIVTFSVADTGASVPAWISAVKNYKQNNI